MLGLFGSKKPEQFCNVCGSTGGFIDNDPKRPRESFRCKGCKTNSRQRLLAFFLGSVLGFRPPVKSWPPDKNIAIFESSGFGGYPKYLSDKFTYYNTDFVPEITAARGYDNKKYADLQAMPYPDNFFDVLLSSDVLEHVRDYKKALSEIYRVLKPGGLMLLQIPYDHNRLETMFRVKVEGDQDVHIMEPYYHAEVHLVYRDYGRDLLGWLKEAGFSTAYVPIKLPRHSIPLQEIFIAAKSGYLELGTLVDTLQGGVE